MMNYVSLCMKEGRSMFLFMYYVLFLVYGGLFLWVVPVDFFEYTNPWWYLYLGLAVLIGFVWLTLTVCFEFLFGHYIAGHSWSRLLEDYNLMAGRLWPLLLVWVTVLPSLVYKMKT